MILNYSLQPTEIITQILILMVCCEFVVVAVICVFFAAGQKYQTIAGGESKKKRETDHNDPASRGAGQGLSEIGAHREFLVPWFCSEFCLNMCDTG